MQTGSCISPQIPQASGCGVCDGQGGTRAEFNLITSFFSCQYHSICRPGSVVGTATGYGWMVRGSNPSGGKIFCTCPDRLWDPPNLLYNGYWVFPRGVKSGRGVTLTPHPLLVLWSWKSRAIPLLPLWAVRPVQSLRACTRVHFTLPYHSVPFVYLSPVLHNRSI